MSDIENKSLEDVSKLDLRTVEVSDAEQRWIRRQFDFRVLPIVCILYTLSYLDRGNIGNVKTAGADTDLGLSSSQWAWVLNAFYIVYVLCEWTQLLWKTLPAHIFVTCLSALWGAAAMCSGAVDSMAGLIACRCFLGMFEAAFGAGAPYYLSFFYQRRELGMRVSLLLAMSPLANCFASALAYGIMHINASIASWRLLFIIEGAPNILFAPVVFFFLPDAPDKAKFLSEAEQTHALERLHTIDRTEKSKLQWSQIFAGLTDYQSYVHTLIHFCCNYSFAALSNFLPTLVKDMGYSSVDSQGLTAPAYLTSFLLCLVAAYVSDKYEKRGYVVAGSATVGFIGYLLLVLIRDEDKTGPRYAGIFLASCGVFPALCINMTWLLNNQGSDSKRGAGLAVLAVLGQCSSFLSSTMFPESDGPFYFNGCVLGCAFTALIVVLAGGLHFKLEYENRKRDRLYGKVEKDVCVDVTQAGDKSHQFRYVT
ncbi:uncharacterized protein K452DRAFT_302769 [Aplosporella prunicola CBS 121167]|uniref:Major facilitator superfamily (MFS) profile domain-containing protein n=1 Tax=Aplosporella prunicola CBS 121167 TaxID=1176127 RepID=A0A6A6AZ24_9PEZI|nr:uncharacterized protein K452DRAFT_302769 [Aplosporella prunicola CBS 121167]KAF2136443.1 hypothetical protein K452DRAFT_302769 [Aplosporella prunicola CBS 121167]